jgi:hypothetical protein
MSPLFRILNDVYSSDRNLIAPHFSQRSAVLPRPFSPTYWTHIILVPSAEQGYSRVSPLFVTREASFAIFRSPLAIQ